VVLYEIYSVKSNVMNTYRQWTKVFARFQFTKTEFYLVLLYNFKIIFYDKHFENIQAKHTTELISFEIQCFDSTFVDKFSVKSNVMNTYRQWTKVFARFQFTLYISYKTTVFQSIILKSIHVRF
jgi:hypothetical protein